ncbi:MAG: PIN domain-containing protein [bacterium]
MVLIDTNILVNRVLKNHVELTENDLNILKKFEEIPAEQLFIPSYIITEFLILIQKVVVKRFHFDKKISQILYRNSITLIGRLITYANIINPTSIELTEALAINEEYFKTNKDLSYTDVLLLVTSKFRGLDLLSMDKMLNKEIEK